MKNWIACAGALVLLAACGSSKDATAAMTAMQLADGKSGMVHYASKSGSGDKVTLKDVVISSAGAAPGDGLKAKTMVLAGLAMTKDGKPWFSDMTLTDITPEKDQPGLTFNLATASVKHANESTGVFLASSFTKEGAGTPPPFDQWELGKLSFNGLKVTGDLAKMGQGKGSFNVLMDEASISDLKKTIVGSSHLGGLKGDFDIPPELTGGYPVVGKFDFGTADMKGLRAGLFADAAKAGAEASGAPGGPKPADMTSLLAKITSPIDPGYDALTWSGLNVQASGVTLATTKVDQKVTRDANGVVTAFSSPRASITFAANAADGQLGALASTGMAAIGYQKVELYAETDATYDPASETARIRKYDLGMTDGFDLQMTGGFQGVLKALTSLVSSLTAMETATLTPDAPKSEPDMSGLEQLKIVDLDLTLTDKSLVGHLLGLGGGDPEALRNDIVTQIKSMGADLSGAGVDKAVSDEFTAAVAAFVKQPGTLNIKLKPAQPVAIAAKDAKLTKATLGFSATATPGPATPAPAPAKPK
ncbi:MAG: hypothetical protein ABI740_05520 [Alphaproteobacteria bacterium]